MRQLAVFLAFRACTGLLGLLPLRVAQRVGQAGGVVAYAAAPGRRRMALRHARRLGAPDPRAQARRMFAAYGRYWAEVFWLRPRRTEEVAAGTFVEGMEHVREALRAGRGVILAVPHVGNWEVAGPVGVREGIDLWAVAENLANRRIRDWFVTLRRSLGIGIVLATGGPEVMRRLEEVLARNGAVALLCDRDLRGKGVSVDFLGERTTLPAGPASLAARTGAPIIPVAVYFRPDGGHDLVVRPPLPLPEGLERKALVAALTQAVADALGALVRTDPGQWHMLQPNWPSDREQVAAGREGRGGGS